MDGLRRLGLKILSKAGHSAEDVGGVMKRSVRLYGLIVLGLAVMFFFACKDKAAENAAIPIATSAVATQVAVAPPVVEGKGSAEDPTPPALPRMDVVSSYSRMIPAEAKALVLFNPADMMDLLDRIPRQAPKFMRVPDWEPMRQRIRDVWGIEPNELGTQCLVAVMDVGPLVMCRGAKLADAPFDAKVWNDGKYSGRMLERGTSVVYIGLLDDVLVIGSMDTVHHAILAKQGQWPALDRLIERDHGRISEVVAGDVFSDIAVLFVDPKSAPWCGEKCGGTGIFASRTKGFEAIVLAEPGTAQMVEVAVKDWWSRSIEGPVKVLVDPANGRGGLPPLLRKAADSGVAGTATSIRGDIVSLKGEGDLMGLAMALNIDIVSNLLGAGVDAYVKQK